MDLLNEGCGRKWFLEKVPAIVQCQHTLWIRRDQQDTDVGVNFSYLFGKIRSRQPWHLNIAYQQIDAICSAGKIQRFLGIAGYKVAEARLLQNDLQQLTCLLVIFCEENRRQRKLLLTL